MLALAIHFPSGRFHATPWGRHVNEGAVEWPPSPWRLLRSFVATWKRKLDTDPACAPDTVEKLLRTLAAPPSFFLPKVATGHTRHYMPLEKESSPPALVFDVFISIAKDESTIVMWPEVTISVEERRALEKISEALGFLGRAEAWAEMAILSDEHAKQSESILNCFPANGRSTGRDQEPVRVLCANPISAFENTYTPKNVETSGKGRNKQIKTTPLYDPDWHLCMETLELHNKRWSDPPGSRWVTYLRPKDCFAIERRPSVITRKRPRPTVARFVVDSPVLPLVEDTLKIAELARRTFMGIYRRIEEQRLYAGPTPEGVPLPRSKVFSGKDDGGRYLQGHQHAFYLPTDEDDDGRIDHLTLVATMGFERSEVNTIDEILRLKREDGEPLNLLLLALGQLEAISARRLFGPSTTWISATPFIVTRHPKKNGRKKDPPELLGPQNQRAFARQVLIEEIARLRELRTEIPEPLAVENLNEEHRIGAHNLRPIQFKRFRQKRTDNGGNRPAGAFRIEFPSAIPGPLCLGHTSHFGLGLFVAQTIR